ncbi:MAG TPA: 1-acyl-sn-glycerol-3-phosphate acyltransferase [Treponema sp.]|nr:1-acyl-sn-glycerol-3-phosphate acyltransferase [Treponema sp.]
MILTVMCVIYVVLSLIVLTPIGLVVGVVSLFGLWKARPVLIYRIAQGWAWLFLKMCRFDMTVLGRENIPRKGGLCFVSNHGGFFDIVMLLAYAGRPFGFVAKKELLLIPLLNVWISMLGGLFIDRKNLRKGLRTINKGIARIKSGGAMVIFPEGRRSRGEGLLPFRSGSLKLATQAQSPIVPVALGGSYEVFERTYRVRKGPLKVVFGKVINTTEIPLENRKHQLVEQVYGVIKEALES